MESVVKRQQAPVFHPLCYFLVQGLVAAVTIHHTKSRSLSRLFSLIIIIWLANLAFNGAMNYSPSGFATCTVTAFSFLYTAQLVNILWINSVSSEDFKIVDVHKKGYSSRSPAVSVLHLVAFNFRGIRTPWELKTVPPFSTYYTKQIPLSRVQFFTRQIAIFAFQYLLIDIIATQATQSSQEDKDRLLGPGLEYTYISATREQWVFRVSSTLGIRWFINRCFLSGLYNFASIIGVASGIFSVEDYPPFMGSVWSGYTLRGYWG
jgi:hypothetical protein